MRIPIHHGKWGMWHVEIELIVMSATCGLHEERIAVEEFRA